MNKDLKLLFEEYKNHDYWDNNLINHSKVVDFESNGPRVLIEPPFRDNKGINFGSVLDTLITDTVNFNNLYTIVEENIIPNEKIQSFLKSIPGFGFIELRAVDKDFLVSEANRLELFPNCKKSETILNKIYLYSEYYDIIQKNRRKKIITRQMYESAVECVEALRSSKMTSWIFDNKFDILYQVPIFSDLYNGTKCKIDILCVDSVNKKIYPFDLKFSSFPENQFIQQAFYKFKYYREAELYENILKDFIDKSAFSDYEVEDFRFIVINDKTLTPIVYKFPIIYDEYDNLKIGNVKTVKPIKDVIDEMRWHIDMNEFDYERALYERMMLCQNEGETAMYPEISII